MLLDRRKRKVRNKSFQGQEQQAVGSSEAEIFAGFTWMKRMLMKRCVALAVGLPLVVGLLLALVGTAFEREELATYWRVFAVPFLFWIPLFGLGIAYVLLANSIRVRK